MHATPLAPLTSAQTTPKDVWLSHPDIWRLSRFTMPDALSVYFASETNVSKFKFSFFEREQYNFTEHMITHGSKGQH